jgi:hypothetical protein
MKYIGNFWGTIRSFFKSASGHLVKIRVQAKRVSVIDIFDRKSVGQVAHPLVSSLDFINPHDDSLLLVGCDDGSIKIFKGSILQNLLFGRKQFSSSNVGHISSQKQHIYLGI